MFAMPTDSLGYDVDVRPLKLPDGAGPVLTGERCGLPVPFEELEELELHRYTC